MKALVVFDSVYGNCEKIANAVGKACKAEVIRAGKAEASALGVFDMIIVGSPTHGGGPVESVKAFLGNIPAGSLKGKRAAAFDTSASIKSQSLFFRGFGKMLGHAAPRIAKGLEKKGATLAAEPEGFGVKGTKGPLGEGELERADKWAAELCKK